MLEINSIPTVITQVVNNDLCIGCGVCVDACPSNALSITWNKQGFLIATTNSNTCNADASCIKVCPFNPDPAAHHKDEDKLAEIFLKNASKHHPKIGRYEEIYAGYSKKYRTTSSSGGIATYIFDRLLTKGLIDHVVTVGGSSNDGIHYSYRIISNKEDLLITSKTRYHPVTLSNALEAIKSLEGNMAISGVACFIKAVRLAQANDPVLKKKVTFLSGIICGGIKSRFFTEYLASRAGAEQGRFTFPEYRIKDSSSTASDYGFSCVSKPSEQTHFIKMREVGDMWGSGLFKANACDYCDDVTTELADVSLGDAWLEPYSSDGQGHNVIVARSPLVTEILLEGERLGDLNLEPLPLDRFLVSQQGSFNHRHDGLAYRTELANASGIEIPYKRHTSVRLPVYLRLVQLARRNTRATSLKIWSLYRDASQFDQKMKYAMFSLRFVTRIAHGIKKIERLVRIKK